MRLLTRPTDRRFTGADSTTVSGGAGNDAAKEDEEPVWESSNVPDAMEAVSDMEGATSGIMGAISGTTGATAGITGAIADSAGPIFDVADVFSGTAGAISATGFVSCIADFVPNPESVDGRQNFSAIVRPTIFPDLITRMAASSSSKRMKQ